MPSQFGPLLRRLRTRAGLTQETLAERSTLGVRTIRGLETGERGDPRVGTVRQLADALDLSDDERVELLAAAGHAVRPAPAAPAPLVDAAHQLAFELGARLTREEEQRQVHDPFPLPVRWRTGPAGLTDSWANVRRARAGETAGPLDLDGSLDQIVGVHRRIPSGRLVILGSAGSGKTILTTRFVLGQLAGRGEDDPVPVVFSLGSWNPATTDLRDWLTEQLLRDHPGLAARGPAGSTLAAALVESGRVLPVLDGFDEIAAGLHRAALAALNATTLPLLLTSRPDEYRAAVAETDVLTAAACVTLTGLTPTDVADYLPRTTHRDGLWEPVLAAPPDHLATVLTTPLMVGLARTLYSDTPDHDPAELLDTARFPTQESIERHLLANFVPTVYRPGSPDLDTERVQHWLGFLAHHLHRLGTPDLAWWQLGDRMPRWLRMVVAGTSVGLLAGVVAGVVTGLVHTLGVGTAGGTGSGFADGLSAGLRAGPLDALTMALTVGLGHGAVLAFGGRTVFEPSRVRIQRRAARRLGAPFLRRLAVGLAVGSGLGVGLGLARELGATFWIVGRIGTTTMTGLLFGLAFGLVFGLVWGLMASFEVPVDLRSAASPTELLTTNRRTVTVQSVVFGLVLGAGYATAVGVVHGAWHGLVNGLSFGLVLGIAVALGVASVSAWGHWLVVGRLWLPLNGRLPWAVPEFLEDAYRRGVLRRAGAVYQFRHARLAEHLAQVFRSRR
ncbi:hypothetical protein BLA60_31090 [Actinophytocola xinjiangensis]|uniref:NACHT domain-containing protein n=1 Tax=Actinophytocola xinjiangensis TaxID=485602 RepID=A0A7Z0WGI8_9PSEU|nr:helix-turn-helix transcriptional regulator [Actinophytocola xinjiangensis]OLF06704.1 hypothetical protein BLA60_31090 [Actinophytocola xinjiangensis]